MFEGSAPIFSRAWCVQLVNTVVETVFFPFEYGWAFLQLYGWSLLGLSLLLWFVYLKLKPHYLSWKQAREDAYYHKNPDAWVARMEAVEAVRRRQQQMVEEQSRRQAEMAREKAERERTEGDVEKRLKKKSREAYLPLSGGGGMSSYKPPKRSACSGGGCGR